MNHQTCLLAGGAALLLLAYLVSSWRIKRLVDARLAEIKVERCPHTSLSRNPADKLRRCNACGTHVLWGWESPPG
jgi:hypothetical protein